MPQLRHLLGRLAQVAVCGCLVSTAAIASEVVEVLGDLQKDFQEAHQQMERYQGKLDRLELRGERDRSAEALSRMVAEVQAIGRGEASSIAALRAKVMKIEELKGNLLLKFPEDQAEIERQFAMFESILDKAETLHLNLKKELETSREWLASTLAERADPEVRERLLSAVRARFAKREASMAKATGGENTNAEETATETPPVAAAEAPRPAPSVSSGLLGHPPVARKAAASPAPSAESKGSVAVDLEQLIQEMER